jgi:hypothetical protein
MGRHRLLMAAVRRQVAGNRRLNVNRLHPWRSSPVSTARKTGRLPVRAALCIECYGASSPDVKRECRRCIQSVAFLNLRQIGQAVAVGPVSRRSCINWSKIRDQLEWVMHLSNFLQLSHGIGLNYLAQRLGSGDGERVASMTRQMPYEPLPASVLFGFG